MRFCARVLLGNDFFDFDRMRGAHILLSSNRLHRVVATIGYVTIVALCSVTQDGCLCFASVAAVPPPEMSPPSNHGERTPLQRRYWYEYHAWWSLSML